MAEQDQRNKRYTGMPSYREEGFGPVVSRKADEEARVQAKAEEQRRLAAIAFAQQQAQREEEPPIHVDIPTEKNRPRRPVMRQKEDLRQSAAPETDTETVRAPIRRKKRRLEGDSQPPVPPERRKWLRHKVVWFLIVIILIIGCMYTLPIPFGHIEVVGSKQVTVSDVIAVGDIRQPVNILQINSTKLADRLQRDLRVETAKVTYTLPATLTVDIKDRQPMAVVQSQFGFAVLDANGQVIQEGPAIEDTTIPIISGIRLGNVLLGDTVDTPGVKAALLYLTKLSPDVNKNIAEVNVGDPKQLIAYTVDGLPIHLGDASDMDKKAKLTEEMLTDVKQKGVAAQYIDVNVTSPFIKSNT